MDCFQVDDSRCVHGATCTFQPVSLPACCVVCMLDDLSNKDQPVPKRTRILSELTACLTPASKLVLAVSEQQQLLLRMVDALTGLLTENDALRSLAVEALVRLGRHTSYDDLEREIVKKCAGEVVYKPQNLVLYRGHICLLGQLLCGATQLSSYIPASFLDCVIFGLQSTDEHCQADIVFLLLTIYKHQQTVNRIPLRLSAILCQNVCLSFCASQLYELQLNLLALIQVLMESPELARLLLESHQTASNASLVRGFRRILTSDDDTLRIATVQCCMKLLSVDGQSAGNLLQSDISEFLCELLTSKNEALLGSALQCLYLLADCHLFYSNCHSIYGIEAIVSANGRRSKKKTPRVSCCGLKLLERILSRQSEHLPLFNSTSLSNECMEAIMFFLSSEDETTETLAWRAWAAFLRRQHIPQLVDAYGKILNAFAQCRRHCPDGSDRLIVSRNLDLLGAVLIAMERAFRLGIQSFSPLGPQTAENVNPFSVDGVSTDQSTDGGLLHQRYCRKLADICDTFCIPWAVMLVKETEGHQALQEAFYRLLSRMVTLEGKIGDALAVKWADVGILELAVDANVKFGAVGKSRGLSNAIHGFLSEICYRLMRQLCQGNDGEAEEVRAVLCDCLPRMTGTLPDCLSLLYHRFSPCCPSARRQTALLALLALSAMHNRRLVVVALLLPALSSFIELIGDVCLLPSLVMKFTTFLFADCMKGLRGSDRQANYQNAEGLLCGALQRLQEPDTNRVLVLHPTLLQWILTSSLRSTSCARTTLLRFLSNYEDLDNCLEGMGVAHEACITCLTETALLDDSMSVPRTIHFLNSLLQTIASDVATGSSTEERDRLVNSMRLLVAKLLSTNRLSPLPDETVQAALNLLTRQSMWNLDVGTAVAAELKYVCQVVGVLERSLKCVPPPYDLVLASLNYLHVASSLASAKRNHQIPSALLSNGVFMQCLERLLETAEASKPECGTAALYLVGLLVDLADGLNTSSPFPIHLSALRLLKLTDSQIESARAAAAMFLWSTLFRVDFQSFVQLTNDIAPTAASVMSQLPINGNVLRRIVIHLQSCLLRGVPITATVAVRCLGELLAYTDRHSASIAGKLVEQPWNMFCVRCCLLLDPNVSCVSTMVLVSLLVKYSCLDAKRHPWPYDEAVSTLTDWFTHLTSLECVDSLLPWAFVQLMQQVIEKDMTDHITDERRHVVVGLLQRMRDSLSTSLVTSDPDKSLLLPKFVDIDGVVVDHRVCCDVSCSGMCVGQDVGVLQTVIEGLLKRSNNQK